MARNRRAPFSFAFIQLLMILLAWPSFGAGPGGPPVRVSGPGLKDLLLGAERIWNSGDDDSVEGKFYTMYVYRVLDVRGSVHSVPCQAGKHQWIYIHFAYSEVSSPESSILYRLPPACGWAFKNWLQMPFYLDGLLGDHPGDEAVLAFTRLTPGGRNQTVEVTLSAKRATARVVEEKP